MSRMWPGGRISEQRAKTPRQPLTILGVGNVLCSDDGLGPVVVSHLKREMHGEGVAIVDGGTLGLSLLPLLEDSRTLILVDAIRADGEPGSLVILEGEDVIPAVRLRLSPHQVGVADLLDAARLLDTMPDRLVLVGLVPDSIELGFGLTDRVSDAVPSLIASVLEKAEELGFPLESGGDDEKLGAGVPGVDGHRVRRDHRPGFA